MFTRNPVTGADERVIEATWGLGETIVAGLVTPDSYRVRRGGHIVHQQAGEKDLAIRRSASGRTEEHAITGDRVHALCLDRSQLTALDQLATTCDASFEGAHDIEWAFAGSKLYLLQRRAITTSVRPQAPA